MNGGGDGMSGIQSRLMISLETRVGKHTLFVGDGGCHLNIFKGNAMTQSSFGLVDLEMLAKLFEKTVVRWAEAKEMEKQANAPRLPSPEDI